jgi:murein DD-endopeptidase MepM/ murein hydrolase activator NlpD
MLAPKIDAQAALDQTRTDEVRQKLAMDRVRAGLVPAGQEEKKLREATQGFEAMFIQQLWKQMRQTVPQEGYLHSREEEMYLSMFDEELSRKMAGAGGIGLGDMLHRELREQLTRSAGGAASRPDAALSPLHASPISLNGAADVKSLAEAEALRPLDASDRRIPLAPRTEPRFDPLLDIDPTLRDGVSSGPQIMQQVTALATRIRLESGEGAPATVATFGPVIPAAASADAVSAPADEGAAPTEAAFAPGAAPAAASTVSAAPAAAAAPGGMHWPVQGEVVSGYGWRTDAVTGAQQWHSGLDIAAAEGDPVAACWDGKVVFAGQRGRFGNMVILEHPGGWRSYYGHNRANLVSEGQTVTAGSKIAEVGTTGRTSDAHLHFEVRREDRAENPLEVMERLQAGLSGTTASMPE